MTTGFIQPEQCILHDVGNHHPERPARIRAILEHLQSSGLYQALQPITAPAASDEQLLRVHPRHYVESLQHRSPLKGLLHLDADTAMMPETLTAAYAAAGAVVHAADRVWQGDLEQVFCCIRPPGHHAERSSAMGFCFFNNMAVAAKHLLVKHGAQRLAILDFDVHHGNGTVDIFKDDPNVLVCSAYQHPYYPDRHTQTQRDHLIHTPLPEYTNSLQFRRAIDKSWWHAIQDHQPQIILICAGFDGHKDDVMAQWELEDADYFWISDQIRQLAAELCQGRIISSLEGGYMLPALGRSVAAHLRGLGQL